MVQPIHGISNLKARNQPLASPPNQIGTIEFPINKLEAFLAVLEEYLFLLGSQRGYAFAPEGMGVAPRTVQKFSTRLVRLYKQGANSSRLGQYADRWCRWSRAGVAT